MPAALLAAICANVCGDPVPAGDSTSGAADEAEERRSRPEADLCR